MPEGAVSMNSQEMWERLKNNAETVIEIDEIRGNLQKYPLKTIISSLVLKKILSLQDERDMAAIQAYVMFLLPGTLEEILGCEKGIPRNCGTCRSIPICLLDKAENCRKAQGRGKPLLG